MARPRVEDRHFQGGAGGWLRREIFSKRSADKGRHAAASRPDQHVTRPEHGGQGARLRLAAHRRKRRGLADPRRAPRERHAHEDIFTQWPARRSR